VGGEEDEDSDAAERPDAELASRQKLSKILGGRADSKWCESEDKFHEQVANQKSHEKIDKAAATLKVQNDEYAQLTTKAAKISFLLGCLRK
jgi:hypothetical protein